MTTAPIYQQIDEYMDYCKYVRQLSSDTLSGKQSTFNQLARFAIKRRHCNDITQLTNQDINSFVKALTKEVKDPVVTRLGCDPRAINTKLAHIVSMLKYFREMGQDVTAKTPLICKLKTGPIDRVWYSSEEVAAVLNCADTLLDWLLIRIMFDTGFRIKELANLRLCQLNGNNVHYVGKGNRSRDGYISEEAYEKLLFWIDREGVTDWIWINEFRNGHYSVAQIRIRMDRVFEKAGFDNFHPHALRHSFCTDILDKGATESEAQQLLGHKNLQTTQIYCHNFDGKIQQLHAKFREQRLSTAA